MKLKLSTLEWFVAGLFLFFIVVTGIWFKLILGVVIVKSLWYMFTGEPTLNSIDKPKKDKPKIPAPLAAKLAQRNKQ